MLHKDILEVMEQEPELLNSETNERIPYYMVRTLYNREVDKKEYETFNVWIYDMLKNDIFILYKEKYKYIEFKLTIQLPIKIDNNVILDRLHDYIYDSPYSLIKSSYTDVTDKMTDEDLKDFI